MEDLKAIKFSKLEKYLSDQTGIPIKLEIKIAKNRNGKEYIKVKSQDIKAHTGCMVEVYEELRLTDFGSSVFEDVDQGVPKPCLWLPINFSFTYKTRGSNGHKFVDSWYYFKDKKWVVKKMDQKPITL